MRYFRFSVLLMFVCVSMLNAQPKNPAEVPAGFINPVLHADYSDPDVIRVGDTYVMTASSFTCTPALPILTSKDLVHWKLVGHALKKLIPEDYYKSVRHGGGVWAPSIRFHNKFFYIFYPDPDFGIYMTRSRSYSGPWSDPVLVEGGKGLIDPCPLWDDNGKAYLVHAYAGSRAGIKSIITVKEMNIDGSKIINEGRVVYDGHGIDPTVEGPKLYKRNGFYYIFVPAGGVSAGWQTVLRSKNIYGPYERKVVMDQGHSNINGPHQGAWVQSPSGKSWFMHFQDKDAYGRVVHLQPMVWKNDWPVIGVDKDGDGTGEPVNSFGLSDTFKQQQFADTSIDLFSSNQPLSPEWQWQANSAIEWYFLKDHWLRLYARTLLDSAKNKYDLPNLLLRKFPADRFEVITKLNVKRMNNGEDAGLMVFGNDYCWVGIQKRDDYYYLVKSFCREAFKGNPETVEAFDTFASDNKEIYLKLNVESEARVSFSFSWDGIKYKEMGGTFIAKPGKWVGAKMGLFASGSKKSNDCGSVDFSFFQMNY